MHGIFAKRLLKDSRLHIFPCFQFNRPIIKLSLVKRFKYLRYMKFPTVFLMTAILREKYEICSLELIFSSCSQNIKIILFNTLCWCRAVGLYNYDIALRCSFSAGMLNSFGVAIAGALNGSSVIIVCSEWRECCLSWCYLALIKLSTTVNLRSIQSRLRLSDYQKFVLNCR